MFEILNITECLNEVTVDAVVHSCLFRVLYVKKFISCEVVDIFCKLHYNQVIHIFLLMFTRPIGDKEEMIEKVVEITKILTPRLSGDVETEIERSMYYHAWVYTLLNDGIIMIKYSSQNENKWASKCKVLIIWGLFAFQKSTNVHICPL